MLRNSAVNTSNGWWIPSDSFYKRLYLLPPARFARSFNGHDQFVEKT